jgi:hypothetical protein
MEQPTPDQSGGGRKVRMGWLIAVAFLLFMIWVISLSTQMQEVVSDLNPMPGMTHEAPATEMPESMPGMDH